jgi:Raf kinase inhibitor-like YbhB/YbcL family protein
MMLSLSGRPRLRPKSAILLSLAMASTACNRGAGKPAVPATAPSLGLQSSSFSGSIPDKYSSCDGKQNISPQLSWQAPPAGTQSFALLVSDPDAPLGVNFVHWVLYDLPPDKRELPEGTPKQDQLSDGSRQGRNGFDNIGYGGPCPPGHTPHHYVFDLYALDSKLNLPSGAARKEVVQAMQGHVLASGELIGTYQR